MKGATQCAQRVRQVVRSLRNAAGRVTLPQVGDPIAQLVLGIFSRDVPESRAREALDRLRGAVVDYNELRVMPVHELVDVVGEYPGVRNKCEDLTRALNRIFAIEHAVTLDRFVGGGRKDVVAYLDRIDGLEDYTRARIRLLGLQQHAFPLDEAMWAYARREGMVDGKCPLGEAQAFLERQVAGEEALEIFALLRREAWSEMGSAVKRGEVERILSVPPDRTSRNMLRQVAEAAAGGPVEEDELPPDIAFDAGDELHAPDAEDAPGDGETEAARSRKGRSARKKPASAPRAAAAERGGKTRRERKKSARAKTN